MDKETQFLEYSSEYNKYVYKKVPSNKKVLDLGCNTGLLGEALIKNKNCTVYGADYSKKAIEVAKTKLNSVQVCDLEKKLPFKNEKFEVIILSDILEHLRQPEDLLKKIPVLLAPKGIIITCIPNVANINIRFHLFFGNWNYKKSGILDRTHLRFFTKKTMKKLIKNTGYEIIDVSSRPGFTFFSLYYFKVLKKIKAALCKTIPSLFAAQFIIVSKKALD